MCDAMCATVWCRTMATGVTLFVVLVVGIFTRCGAQESSCCNLVSGSCRSACSQVSLATLAVATAEEADTHLTDVSKFCPPEMAEFWQCFNQTLEEVSSGAGWSGRACCALPRALSCRRACATASSRRDLRAACRLSDELAFFACVDRQQAGDECCVHARSGECGSACAAVFRAQQTPSRELRAAANAACAHEPPRLQACLRNATRLTPATNAQRLLHCCEKTDVPACREACRRVLRSAPASQEIVDALERAGCGPPLPHAALWQCFLQPGPAAGQAASRIDRVGMDAAKLHCCAQATRDACRRLCVRTFSNEWTRSWADFHATCLATLSEDALAHCLDEVEEPCELGCDGLSFCTNFNNRPTELFRSCGRAGDDAARFDVAQWTRQAELALPGGGGGGGGGGGARLPLRNLSACSPRRWRAVACSLQLRPCHAHSHTNRICREDCMSLLSTCVDWGRARAAPGGAALSAAAVCSQLSPDNPATPCVSLQPFLAPSDGRYWPPQDAPLAPCRAQPCNGSHVCLVNRNCAPGRPCLPYSCVPGCRLGEVSQYVVPVGTWVRLAQGAGARDCPKACQCGAAGALENCQPLACVYFDPCMLSDHQKIAHKAWFYLGCNVCTCFAGEVTCSKRQCDEGGAGGVGGALMDSSDAAVAALPCRCPPHYVPVCGRNGNTYPSSCLARCAGLTDVDFEFGPCSMRDPCAQATCAPGQRCVPARKTCLSLQYRSCPQHECVDVTSSCSTQAHEPVCDTEGVEHPNLCYLLKDNKVLAYRGPCLEGCSRTGVVCGADGNSYASECAAWAARAPVDYAGPCAAVGFVSDAALAQCGAAGVHCPALPLNERGGLACDGLTPPGACCPVCAGALRLLYSHKQVDRILYSLKGAALEALTVHSVLAALERQVQIADCSVRGYLTVELDLIALVMPAGRGGRPASALQREACAREAEKLASLVQRSSPRMLSELSLSVLSTANVAHSQVPAGASVIRPSNLVVAITIAIVFSSIPRSLA